MVISLINNSNQRPYLNIYLKIFLVLFIAIFGFLFGLQEVQAQTAIYRSVGPSATSALTTGASNALTISGTTATFDSDLPSNIGVGDVVQYDSDGNGSIDAVAFIHGRTDAKTFTVANAAGGTPTAVTGDNDWSIFRAYISLSNAETGTENTGIADAVENFDTWSGGKDLTISNEVWNITLYANGTTNDSAVVVIDGWTTDATRYINIYTPIPPQVGTSQRHAGVWDDNKYKLNGGSGGDTPQLQINSNYTRVTGMQARTTDETVIAINGANVLLDSLIVKDCTRYGIRTTAVGATNVIVRNTLVYNTGRYGIGAESGSMIVENSTVVDAGWEGYGSGGTITVTNSIGYSNGDQVTIFDFRNHVNATYSYNASSDGSADDRGGAGNVINISDPFVDFIGRNFHINYSATEVVDKGTTLSFSTDIDGDTRPLGAAWDIGADEASPPTVIVRPTVKIKGGIKLRGGVKFR